VRTVLERLLMDGHREFLWIKTQRPANGRAEGWVWA
jgi:hypothetical protein